MALFFSLSFLMPKFLDSFLFRNQLYKIFHFSNKSSNQTQQFLKSISWRLSTVQHVSGVLTPIIRSLTTAVAASGFTVGVWW